MAMNEDMVRALEEDGVLRTPQIAEAFRAVDRRFFVPRTLRDDAYLDMPLPIGYGATISQPWTVAYMLELLQPGPNERVLDIGSGSGWTTALFAHLVGGRGRVFGVEVVPELAAEAGRRLARSWPELAKRATFVAGDASSGLPLQAPFDVIHAAADVSAIPESWKEQLAPRGRMVVPRRGSLVYIEATEDGRREERVHHGFSFVPFREA